MCNFKERITCPMVPDNHLKLLLKYITWMEYNVPELVGFWNRDSSVIWNTECHGDSSLRCRQNYQGLVLSATQAMVIVICSSEYITS